MWTLFASVARYPSAHAWMAGSTFAVQKTGIVCTFAMMAPPRYVMLPVTLKLTEHTAAGVSETAGCIGFFADATVENAADAATIPATTSCRSRKVRMVPCVEDLARSPEPMARMAALFGEYRHRKRTTVLGALAKPYAGELSDLRERTPASPRRHVRPRRVDDRTVEMIGTAVAATLPVPSFKCQSASVEESEDSFRSGVKSPL